MSNSSGLSRRRALKLGAAVSNAWADKNKVDVHVDFITSNGNKLLMTGAAEAQAKTGHDIYTFYNWEV